MAGRERLAAGLVEGRDRIGRRPFDPDPARPFDDRPAGEPKRERDDIPARPLGTQAADLGVLSSVQTAFLGIDGSRWNNKRTYG